MIFKALEFPLQEFKSLTEMHNAIKSGAERIIQLKQSEIYKSSEKGQLSIIGSNTGLQALKGVLEIKENFIYPVISTTRYMDSHKDCHFDGCFKKTVKEQKGKVSYALDHNLLYDSILAWPEDVKMSINDIPWADLGKAEYSGTTQGLVFAISKDAIRRKDVLLDIEQRGSKFENSIRMIYHKIVLGVNSENKEMRAERDYYEKRIDSIVNSDLVKEDGYFWGVEELGIYKEGSLVVAGGSNDATAIFTKNIEPLTSTHKTEPLEDTQEKEAKRKILSII